MFFKIAIILSLFFINFNCFAEFDNFGISSFFNSRLQVGTNGNGYDAIFYGDTSDKYLFWDASEDNLLISGYLGVNAGSKVLHLLMLRILYLK